MMCKHCDGAELRHVWNRGTIGQSYAPSASCPHCDGFSGVNEWDDYPECNDPICIDCGAFEIDCQCDG